MKALSSLLIAIVLLLFLVATLNAQDNTTKQNPALMQDEAPWGMKIVFTPGTTITQANQLRLEHNLGILPIGYQAPDGRTYHYEYPDDSEYQKFARFHYRNTVHADCIPCPPITPISAYYEPVSEEVETALLADPRVSQLDNRNDQGFFFITMIKALIEVLWQRWTSAPTGPVASS